MTIYNDIINDKKKGLKKLAVLLDPDKHGENSLVKIIKLCNNANVDYFFIGGSLMNASRLDTFIQFIKGRSAIPCILFPGSTFQFSTQADAILYLSMISGRNPDLLIGKHVETSLMIKNSGLEVLPTGYMLIDGGKTTSVHYMSNTQAIPADKPNIAAATALAGELLGLKLMYLEAGSGAINPVSEDTIKLCAQTINTPLIVGGGIKSTKNAQSIIQSGADLIVVGNALENDPELVIDLSVAVHSSQHLHPNA